MIMINTRRIVITLVVVLIAFILANIFFPELSEKYILPISKSIGLLSLSVGIWVAIGEFQIKNAAEIRLSKDAKAENDVKLLTLFTKMFEIAHSRPPVGRASQEAAIIAVGELGVKYEVLREPALQGLKSLKEQFVETPDEAARSLTPISNIIQISLDKFTKNEKT